MNVTWISCSKQSIGLNKLLGGLPSTKAVDVMGFCVFQCSGLAAGLDKNATLIEALGALTGFFRFCRSEP